MTVEQIQEFRVKMGFDRPWYVQYFSFAWKALHGDFGYSFVPPPAGLPGHHGQAAGDVAACGLRLRAVAGGLHPAGRAVGRRGRNTPVDNAATVLALAGQSIPSFWLGILLILFFGVSCDGCRSRAAARWQHMIMPGITLAAFPIARNMRLTRSSMLDFMQRDFVRTARAKGIRKPRVVNAHVLRNSLLPIVTAIGLELGFLLGGSVITETIFGWPGVGREIVSAIGSKDFFVVQAGVDHAGADIRRREPPDRSGLCLDRSAHQVRRMSARHRCRNASDMPVRLLGRARRGRPVRQSEFVPRLLRSKAAMVSVDLFAVVLLAAVAAPWIAPNDPFAIRLIQRLKPPGYVNGAGIDLLAGH